MKIIKKNLEGKYRIAITLGDPAGIGTEIILKALSSPDLPINMQPLLIGCKRNIELIFNKLKANKNNIINDLSSIQIENIPFSGNYILGKPSLETGNASFNWLTYATKLVLNKQARALVTGPISKYAWHQSNHFYPGQTERLAELAKIKNPSMLFTASSPINKWRLNTLLATTHIPLKEIPNNLNEKKNYFKT